MPDKLEPADFGVSILPLKSGHEARVFYNGDGVNIVLDDSASEGGAVFTPKEAEEFARAIIKVAKNPPASGPTNK